MQNQQAHFGLHNVCGHGRPVAQPLDSRSLRIDPAPPPLKIRTEVLYRLIATDVLPFSSQSYYNSLLSIILSQLLDKFTTRLVRWVFFLL